MKGDLSKLKGKHIWVVLGYTDTQYKLVQVIDHIKFHDEEDFFVCRCDSGSVHGDGGVASMVFVIDAHNDMFYPNTDRVKEIIEAIEANKDIEKSNVALLSEVWLNHECDGT